MFCCCWCISIQNLVNLSIMHSHLISILAFPLPNYTTNNPPQSHLGCLVSVSDATKDTGSPGRKSEITCQYDGLGLVVRRAGLLWSQQDFEWRWSVPLFKCPTVLEFSFILFDLCLLITFFNFIMNYVPIVTFWIFTYHKIWILSIMFCFIWSYWIIYFLACLEVSWRVVS